MSNYHHERFGTLTFRALALRQSATITGSETAERQKQEA